MDNRLIHIQKNNVEQAFMMRRLCDSAWEHMCNIMYDPYTYNYTRPVCAACDAKWTEQERIKGKSSKIY
jgi:hypothetical protein